jgi:hypothetical protein
MQFVTSIKLLHVSAQKNFSILMIAVRVIITWIDVLDLHSLVLTDSLRVVLRYRDNV